MWGIVNMNEGQWKNLQKFDTHKKKDERSTSRIEVMFESFVVSFFTTFYLIILCRVFVIGE